MNPKETNTWKDWVDWAPTYWILGGCLAYGIYKTGILQTVLDKFTKKDDQPVNSSQTQEETN